MVQIKVVVILRYYRFVHQCQKKNFLLKKKSLAFKHLCVMMKIIVDKCKIRDQKISFSKVCMMLIVYLKKLTHKTFNSSDIRTVVNLKFTPDCLVLMTFNVIKLVKFRF